MIEFRGLCWLTIVATLGACTVEAPDTLTPPAVPEASSQSTPAESVDTAPSPPSDPPDAGLLTAEGWGPLRIGMTLAEITAAAGADAHPGAVGGPDPAQCDEFRPADAPEGVLVMVENGVLTRISVSRNADIRTPEGFRIGDPASRVLTAYGSRARVEPHKYQESPASYITVWRVPRAEPDPRGLRYEIDAQGNIAHIRGGGPSIEYVEGCL